MESGREYKAALGLLNELEKHQKKCEAELIKGVHDELVKEIDDHFASIFTALATRKDALLVEVAQRYKEQEQQFSALGSTVNTCKDAVLFGAALYEKGQKEMALHVWKGIQNSTIPTLNRIVVKLPTELLSNVNSYGSVQIKEVGYTAQFTEPQLEVITVPVSNDHAGTGTEPNKTEQQSSSEPPLKASSTSSESLEVSSSTSSESTTTTPPETINSSSERKSSFRDQETTVRGVTELHIEASKEGNIKEFQKVLKDKKAQIGAVDDNGETPLHKAAKVGAHTKAAALIEHGAKVDATCDLGNTPLHLASTAGKLLVVEVLIRMGANVKATNKTGQTPLQCATDTPTKEHLTRAERQCVIQ